MVSEKAMSSGLCGLLTHLGSCWRSSWDPIFYHQVMLTLKINQSSYFTTMGLLRNTRGAAIQDKQARAKAIGKFNKRKECYKRKKEEVRKYYFELVCRRKVRV